MKYFIEYDGLCDMFYAVPSHDLKRWIKRHGAAIEMIESEWRKLYKDKMGFEYLKS